MLHGREIERARLAALLDDAGDGRAGVLVVHGEAGVGKSALLDDLAAAAGHARVLRTQGLESESPLAFAALHRLLRPVVALLDRLPVPQARALRVAFGQEDGPAVEPFLVAIATLSMLTEAAEQAPVLCVVDDAHWLDTASADALLFAARRLQADRVAVVFAARDTDATTFTPDGVPSLLLTGLNATAAGARVRHPLVRSAVYQAATGLERREAHRGIAEALGEADDPDRQAWHRAAAADGPDDDIVAALDAAAVRAERRGGYAAAAAAYERAAELTTGEQPRAARLFAAARNAWDCGQPIQARALAIAARELAEDRLRGRIEVNVGVASDAHRIFTRAARAVAADDPVRALEMAVAAGVLGIYGAESGIPLVPTPIPTVASPVVHPRTRCLTQLMASTTAAIREDWAPALVSLRAALHTGTEVSDPDVLANLGNTALHLGDDDAHQRCFTRMLSGARDAGAAMSVLYALPRLVFTQVVAGQWADASSSASEALALSVSSGQRPMAATPLAWLTVLAAQLDLA